MEELKKQVRRAHRRMGFQRLAGVLGWCWFATLLIALVLITVDKFYRLGVEPWGWVVGALALGTAMAVVWIVVTRRSSLGAAIEIDHRFGLKERVSSTLALPAEDYETEAGQALIHDAVHRVRRLDVATQFSVAPGKRILLPLLPAIAALLVALFVSPAVVDNPAAAKPDSQAVKQQVKESTNSLRRRLAERREKAKQQGLKDAEDLFKRLEEGTKRIGSEATERKRALVKLNDLARELQQRQQKLGGAENVKKQLDQLKNIDRGPASKFAKAVRQGDFKQAAEELEKIKDQIAGSKLDEEQKKQLAGQLEQIQQKLNQMAEAQQAAQEDLQKRIEQLQQAGQMAEANKLEEQLNKLLQQAPQMDQLQQLAQKMGQCAQCLRNGQLADADQQLQGLQEGLQNLQQQLDELEMLEDAMQQLCQAKDQMNCKQCGGFG
ncbi:MAG: hypothetical protein JXB62_23315 [Pirellulales bacterium]|nr:hypothetical protein [Pirellulales bacterium]